MRRFRFALTVRGASASAGITACACCCCCSTILLGGSVAACVCYFARSGRIAARGLALGLGSIPSAVFALSSGGRLGTTFLTLASGRRG